MAIAPPPPAERPVVEDGTPTPLADEILAPSDHPDASAAPPVGNPMREAMIRNGAGWLILIAALSLVNVGAAVSGSEFSFALGLVVAQVVAIVGGGIATEAGIPAIGWVAGALAAAIALGFGALYFPARQGKGWVFVLALVLYGLDAVLLLGLSAMVGDVDVLGIGIHAWALWSLWRSWDATRSPA